MIKKIISYPLTVIFYLCFGLTLVVFHPLQWLGLKLGGANSHRKVVNYMNFFLLRSLHVLGTSIQFKNTHKLPQNRPFIIAANHQSMYDIPLISWFLRQYKPKFISKIELGKGIPSVSFNLKYGGSVLIDRKNPKQSLPALSKFGKSLIKNTYSGVIFPEGTRSRNGNPKKFAHTGLKILFKNAPEALVVPVSINNSWKLVRFGSFPMEVGVKLSLEVQEPIEINSVNTAELLEIVENRVVSGIDN